MQHRIVDHVKDSGVVFGVDGIYMIAQEGGTPVESSTVPGIYPFGVQPREMMVAPAAKVRRVVFGWETRGFWARVWGATMVNGFDKTVPEVETAS